jgi:hypothetical protein
MTIDRMSDTPRTDVSAFWVTSPTDPEMQEEVVVSHFTRQLERAIRANNAKVKAQCDGRTCNDRSEDSPCPNCPMEYWIEI